MELSVEKEYVGISAIYQFLGNGVQMVSGSIFYIVAARIFNTSDMGSIALFIAIIGLFSIVFSVGLNTAATHFISANLASAHYSVRTILLRILSLGIGISILGFAVVFGLSSEISFLFFHSPLKTNMIKLLAIVLVGNILFSILNGAVLGFQRFKASAIISVAIWVMYYFGALAFAFFDHSLYTIIFGWIIGMAAGILIDIAYLFLIALKGSREMQKRRMGSRSIFIYSLPIVLSSLISYGASYTDRFVVAYLMDTSSLGIYNFALLIFSGISFIAIPFNNITLPKFSAFFGRGDREAIRGGVESSTLLLSFIYIPSTLGIASLSSLILYFIAGPNYVSASYALMIVMIIPAFVISSNILTQAISAIRRTKFFLYSSILSLIANVVVSFILIPPFGLVGAALGFSSVSLSTFAILYYLARKENLVKYNIMGIGKIWVSSIIMFLVLVVASNYLHSIYGYSLIILLMLLLIGAGIFVIISRYMRIFSEDEKAFIRSLFPERMKKLRMLIEKLILH